MEGIITFMDVPSYITMIAEYLNSNYFYFLKKIEEINQILICNKKKENELEWRINKLESIIIENNNNNIIIVSKDRKFKKYQEIYVKKS